MLHLEGGLSHYFEGQSKKETLKKKSEIQSCVQAEILFCDDMISEEIFLNKKGTFTSASMATLCLHPHISFLTVRENLAEKIQ